MAAVAATRFGGPSSGNPPAVVEAVEALALPAARLSAEHPGGVPTP